MNNKRLPKILIRIIVEGFTERNYINGLKNNYLSDDFKLDIFNVRTGNYSEIYRKLKEFQGIEIPVLIVADLDRAADDKNELKYLEKLIGKMQQPQNGTFNNIFLTYKNFETFLSANFIPFAKNYPKNLGNYTLQELKNKEDLYDLIKRNNGSFENAKSYFNNKINNLCFNKIDKKRAKFDKEKIHLEQSSFVNFIEYCNYIKSSRK
ncbi:MAG: hypothetical protein IJ211_03760 [Campylobacter sp.]|nr:hypothetical protein [Campylobacter sp.]